MQWREFQAEQKVAELDSRFVSYVDQGSGMPVVLLHGIPTWSYLWHGVLPSLAAACRVLAPDLIGFGFSDRRDTFDRSIARQAEMIEGWMQRLGIERAAVVGHDIGGGVALRLVTLFPHRVGSLALLNSVCYDSWPIELMLQLGHPEARRKLSASTAMKLLDVALRQGFSSRPSGDLIEGLLAPYRTEVGKLSLIRNAAALNTNLTTEITPLLSKIDVKTLILWGEDDPFQPVELGERLAWDISGAHLARVPGARHFLMFDQPERVSRALLEHLGGG